MRDRFDPRRDLVENCPVAHRREYRGVEYFVRRDDHGMWGWYFTASGETHRGACANYTSHGAATIAQAKIDDMLKEKP